MPRTNQIGVNVQNRSKTETDKNNISPRPNETEKAFAYPELEPGRALINLATGDIIEFQHRINGFTDTVEGRLTSGEEYYNKEYGTREGQDWGGIIEDAFLSFTVRQCPEPNEHGEIHIPLDTPDESDVIDMTPSTFEQRYLFDGHRAQPLLIVERPEASYEEVMAGDTYSIVGWYDPSENTESDRIKPVETISHQHPEIVGVEYTTTTKRSLPRLDVSVDWKKATTGMAVTKTSDGYSGEAVSELTDFSIDVAVDGGQRMYFVDAPFDARETINGNKTNPSWDGRRKVHKIDAGNVTLETLVEHYTSDGWEVSVSGDAIDFSGKTTISVTPASEETAEISDIFAFAFSEDVSVGSQLRVPGSEATVDTEYVGDAEFIEVRKEDGVDSVTVVSEPNESHFEGVVDEENGKIGFKCSEDDSSLPKRQSWKETRYNYDIKQKRWTMNTCAVEQIIDIFMSEGKAVTMRSDAVERFGEEVETTESRSVDVDSVAASNIESHSIESFELEVTDEENTPSCRDVHGVSSVNHETLTLLNLELSVGEQNSSINRNVDIGASDIAQLPNGIRDQWLSNTDVEETGTYEWFHPETSARIRVEPVNNEDTWGEEYAVLAMSPKGTSMEKITTVADERDAVLTVITHMKGYAKAFN